MEGIRLNKLLSGAGVCSRRDADRFIEMGRVTINGKAAVVGQRVMESDIVMLDDIKVDTSQMQDYSHNSMGKTRNLIFGGEDAVKEKKAKQTETVSPTTEKKKSPFSKLRPGKYIKYNKYAAARKAAKRDEDGSGASEREQTERRTRR